MPDTNPTKKTAVILVHGIGEQRPMDTLSGFVKAAWVHDETLIHPSRAEVFSKPEMATGSYELRRFTTRQASYGDKKRADFFEFYWAHHMQGHTMGQFFAWLKDLFWRNPATVPPKLRYVWWTGVVAITASLGVVALWTLQKMGIQSGVPGWLAAALPVTLAVVGWGLEKLVLPYAGDAARYLSARPDNVAIRQVIREQGVSLIESLTNSGDYDRIVLVGHSLGSVIAYDILNFAWGRQGFLHLAGSKALKAMEDVERLGLALRNAPENKVGTTRIAYRNAQRAYGAQLAKGGGKWLVSDLVTMGSPLGNANVLVAHDNADFAARQIRRELPTCPPVYERELNGALERFSYPLGAKDRKPHHAAAFGAVVWTNIYVPHRFVVIGDVISAAVAPLFGRGVADIRLPIGWPPGFRHTSYWAKPEQTPPSPAIKALRRALDLRPLAEESAIWGNQAGAVPIAGEKLGEGDR